MSDYHEWYRLNIAGMHYNQQTASRKAWIYQQKRIEELEANNTDLTNRNALLRQRPDLHVDRIPAHNEMIRLQARVEELEATCAKFIYDEGDHPPPEDKP